VKQAPSAMNLLKAKQMGTNAAQQHFFSSLKACLKIIKIV
jgi:hypothetical protein